jgi:hypothetical protein
MRMVVKPVYLVEMLADMVVTLMAMTLVLPITSVLPMATSLSLLVPVVLRAPGVEAVVATRPGRFLSL